MLRSLLFSIGLLFSMGLLLAPRLATAQAPAPRTVAVWSATATDLRDLEREALRVAHSALPGAPNVESACDPSDAGCVTSMLHGTTATHVLSIHVHWARGGCVAMRRDGEVVGHRMLRDRVVEFALYAADGSVLGSIEVRVASQTDVAPIEAALAELVAL